MMPFQTTRVFYAVCYSFSKTKNYEHNKNGDIPKIDGCIADTGQAEGGVIMMKRQHFNQQ